MIIKDKNLDPNIYISKNFESLTHQVNHSLYSKHLSNWLNIIPNNQILFINSNISYNPGLSEKYLAVVLIA